VKGLGASAGNGHQPRNGASDYLIPNTQHLHHPVSDLWHFALSP
jgi:hypothetical protein